MPPLPKAKPKQSAKPKEKAPLKSQKEKGRITKDEPSGSTIPVDLQQLLLNIFRDSFAEILQSNIKPLLQEVKGHLFNRDFAAAFGKQEYLEAYAARWSPSRALGYLQIFDNLRPNLRPFLKGSEEGAARKWKIVCLGGGAGAEIVALAGLMKMLDPTSGKEQRQEEKDESGQIMEVVAIDVAAWGPVVANLSNGIVRKPPLSAYASAAAKETNFALLDQAAISITFHQYDILSTPFPTLAPIHDKVDLVTLLFTLNELYSTSVPLTQAFLLNMTEALRLGTMLLVVDSPGSYSTVTLKGKEGNYPMSWLLDHLLLGKGSREEGKKGWEKVLEDESQWFRMEETLNYPIELENMRVQIHLYRRVE